MKSRTIRFAMTVMAALAAGPALAGGDPDPAGTQAAAADRLESAIRAREARMAELQVLSEELEAAAREKALRDAERQGFRIRLAAEDEERARAQREAEMNERARAEGQREAETEERLKEAEMRLEEAAREIAELTAQIVGEVTPAVIEGVNAGFRRAMLGVNVKNLGDADDKAEGVLIVGVTPGWPADEAGIRTGDVLVDVAGTKLDWSGDTSPMNKLVDKLRDVESGDVVKVRYRRDGEARTAEVTTRSLGENFAWHFETDNGETVHEYRFAPPPPMPGAPHVERDVRILRNRIINQWGDMELVELTPGLGDYFGTDEGVLVVRAPKDDTLGLQDGDVILDIGGRKPVDPGHVIRILRSYEPGEKLAMTIVRKKKRQSISVEVPKAELHRAPPAPAPAPTAAPAAPAPRPAPLKT
jgi:S1-C subfamily serine protease